ncbi:MAG: helix-turn-helix transcriptional regulator [Bradyrhizobium sp.]|jgi:DNA-binding XRE family transcriptional regulator|nr:helix-turn-helix transcriptional regulator [Bradyrhizobium sp.]MDU6375384.1 helix-turn-helix transcriptional regulator [Bradyrhizobium sp.]
MTQVDSWDLKKWRKKFGYNQFEAAEKLGVNRGAVQNWEREIRPVPKAVELACEELNQFAKRHPGFGPVLLVYTDGPLLQPSQEPYQVSVLLCESYPTNEAAIQQACRLTRDPLFVDPIILGEDGSVIWDSPALLKECDRRFTDKSRCR